MILNKHLDLEGKHSLLSPSNYHWVNYSNEKFDIVFKNLLAKEMGVRLHEFAKNAIELKIKQPEDNKTLNLFINDAINLGMVPEQILVYSKFAFGTADAILYKNNILYISDLKTGVIKASMKQLEIYAALFSLEYEINVYDTDFILKIYQNDEVREHHPTPQDIVKIMDKIIEFDKRIEVISNGL